MYMYIHIHIHIYVHPRSPSCHLADMGVRHISPLGLEHQSMQNEGVEQPQTA